MKKLILLLPLSLLLIFSCSEMKTKKAIKEYLKYTLNDYKSYEPVQFGPIEMAMSSYVDLPQVKQLLSDAQEYTDEAKRHKEDADYYDAYEYPIINKSYMDKFNEDLDRAKKYLNKIDSIKLQFVPWQTGWKQKHTFRARIPAGGYKLNEYEFYFDKEFKKVIEAIDLSELE